MSPDYYRALINDVLRSAGTSNPQITNTQPPAPAPQPASEQTIEITIKLPLRLA